MFRAHLDVITATVKKIPEEIRNRPVPEVLPELGGHGEGASTIEAVDAYLAYWAERYDSQDAKDNKIFEQTKLTMPVMAVGGEKSFGPLQAVIMRHVATNVQEEVVAGSGHWLMEEKPEYTVALIRKFLDGPVVAHTVASSDTDPSEERLTPAEYKFPQVGNPGTGSSGVGGIRTVVLKGNPDQASIYTIMLRVPAHTRIAAHSHRDDRVATVISGTWHIGYGDKFDTALLKALPPGSFYTEPSAQNHFAETEDEPVVVQITGFGPSSTEYVDQTQDPRGHK